MEIKRIEDDPYIAHCKDDLQEIQSVSAHNQETAQLAQSYCTVEALTAISYLAAVLHDCGKYSDRFQEYIRQGEASPFRRGEVNHSTAGGILMEELAPKTSLSEIIQIVIYSHHGLQDAVDLGTGSWLIERRQSKEYQEHEKIEIAPVRQRFYQYTDKELLNAVCSKARESMKTLMGQIKKFMGQTPAGVYGSRDFYMGMHERLLLSLLIDADRSNTWEFMNGMPKREPQTEEATAQLWQQCIVHFEDYISRFPVKTKIDEFRREISDACLGAASEKTRLYRLTLPTGSGKTLSGLRFALHHAKKFGKQRIIYVAPFTSILEQNSETIRQAIGQAELVLEHHCNVISDTEEAQERYGRLTENWMSPVIATTAVQFLNTLFSAKTGSVRRMHSLCGSMILFDEIQALPVRTISLFNLAVNYLTTFCDTTVVLCSATQPVFDKLPKNRLLPPKELVEDYVRYDEAFRRVTLIDRTEIKPGGLTVEELGDFVLEQFAVEKQILVIVNTKTCARNLYLYLKKHSDRAGELFHLSTNMCALNRREVLDRLKECLETEDHPKPVICVSTQLIEAGVDLSFRCVIRSLAGLDNLIQAAGRCNRHGAWANGNVYLVKMSDEAERVSRLTEIKTAQTAMEEILRCYKEAPETVGRDLLSAKAKEQYYLRYLRDQTRQTEFCVNVHGADTTLVELLSENETAKRQYRRHMGKPLKSMMKQSFRTAGEQFEVISEEGKRNVVVEYDEEVVSMLEELQNPYILYRRQKEILRRLQLASVGISEQMKNELGRAITPVCGGLVNVLSISYYSKETGVSTEPVGMKLISM